MTTITIPLKISPEEIKMLADELNNFTSDSSDLAIFIEKILKETNRTIKRNQEIENTIKKINPFSCSEEN